MRSAILDTYFILEFYQNKHHDNYIFFSLESQLIQFRHIFLEANLLDMFS